jgi:hypothetical protein
MMASVPQHIYPSTGYGKKNIRMYVMTHEELILKNQETRANGYLVGTAILARPLVIDTTLPLAFLEKRNRLSFDHVLFGLCYLSFAS